MRPAEVDAMSINCRTTQQSTSWGLVYVLLEVLKVFMHSACYHEHLVVPGSDVSILKSWKWMVPEDVCGFACVSWF